MAQVEVEDKPKGVAKNLRAKSAHVTRRPSSSRSGGESTVGGRWMGTGRWGGAGRGGSGSAGEGEGGEVGKRRGIYVRQKISKLDLTRAPFFWTTAYIYVCDQVEHSLRPLLLALSLFFAIPDLSANTRAHL